MTVVEQMSRVWCELLQVPTAEPDQNFFDLGGDSLTALDFIARVQSATGWTPPAELLFADGDFGALVAAAGDRAGPAGT